MKKQLLAVALMCITAVAFGQKKEIKKAERAIKSEKGAEAVELIKQAEGMIGSADNAVKAQFYLVKAEAYIVKSNGKGFEDLKEAAEAMKMANQLEAEKAYADRMAVARQQLRVGLVGMAINEQKAGQFKGAAEKMYLNYTASPMDTSDLYAAADMARLGKDNETALKYFNQLMDMGYTGISKQYLSIDENGAEQAWQTEDDRDRAVLLGGQKDGGERVTPSVKGDLLIKMASIYIEQGDNDRAKGVIQEARKLNPDDADLIRAEADIAYKLGDMSKYNELMEEVIELTPNDPTLFYNLGVSAGEIGESEKAIGYYQRAIELKPDFTEAYINTAFQILKPEGAIIEEMNNLGMSAADEKRYDELKEQRTQLYKDAVPYLEKAVELSPDNANLVRTLMNIYSQVGMDDKYKATKAKLEAMEGGQ